MNYRPRKGIVMVRICDANLLIPDRQASQFCKGIRTLSVFDTLVWKQLEKGKTVEEIKKLLSAFLPGDPDKASARINKLMESLMEQGFVEEIGNAERSLP